MIRQIGMRGRDQPSALFPVQRHRDQLEARPHGRDQDAAALVMEIEAEVSVFARDQPANRCARRQKP